MAFPAETGMEDTTAPYRAWWQQLSANWQQAFNEALFQQKDSALPDEDRLQLIFNLNVIRMAGPSAMFPNMSVTLDDLSGVGELVNLEILVVVNHRIRSLKGLSKLEKLHSLFVFSNEIDSLDGIEELPGLKQLFINDNRIESLLPLSGLVNLESVHCANNNLVSLEGIGHNHTALKDFFCLPNEGIWQSEILRFETAYHIRCQKG